MGFNQDLIGPWLDRMWLLGYFKKKKKRYHLVAADVKHSFSADCCVKYLSSFIQNVRVLYSIHAADAGIWSRSVSTERSLLFEGRGPETITSALMISGRIKASFSGRTSVGTALNVCVGFCWRENRSTAKENPSNIQTLWCTLGSVNWMKIIWKLFKNGCFILKSMI